MTVIIIGSSSGIGYGLAHSFLDEGRRVLGVSRSTPEELNFFPNYTHLNLDITSSTSLTSFSTPAHENNMLETNPKQKGMTKIVKYVTISETFVGYYSTLKSNCQ